MQKVLTAAEMREVDRLTTERYGIPSIILMENAAHAVARVITEKLGGSVKGKSILILCGKGNNGGDGAALARVLWQMGARIEIVLFGKVADSKGDARVNFEFLKRHLAEPTSENWYKEKIDTGSFVLLEREDGEHFRKRYRPHLDPQIVVDAILGTGVTRPVEENLRQVFCSEWFEEAFFRDRKFIVLSVDLPSGLTADNGQSIGEHVAAEVTVTFTAPKPANVLAPAARSNGELIIANIGTPQTLVNQSSSELYLSEKQDVFEWMYASQFSGDSYKNKRGHALIIAGSENYAGAATLCGNAAIRSGVGLVTIGTPRSSKDLVGGRVVPEVMVRPLAETESGAISEEAIAEIEKFSKNIDAIAIGAGLSASDESTGRFVRHFVENRMMPTILDADALTLLSPFERVTSPRVSSPHGSKGSTKDEASQNAQDPPVILTPHEGEFMRLLGTDDKEAIKDRVGAVRKFAQEKNVILVLKGERVLIGEPGGRVVVNPTGNSGLGKAGNGDTLLGILAGFAAQAAAMEIDMFETIVAGVYIAALAGDIAAEKFGKRVMTASDTRDCLAEAFRRCEGEN
jgi:ADP-dependent NAD(P)H-hydrate dehydratase / NAD(P)H-hydrate epimerase